VGAARPGARQAERDAPGQGIALIRQSGRSVATMAITHLATVMPLCAAAAETDRSQ
jgi:hypothetical protein